MSRDVVNIFKALEAKLGIDLKQVEDDFSLVDIGSQMSMISQIDIVPSFINRNETFIGGVDNESLMQGASRDPLQFGSQMHVIQGYSHYTMDNEEVV